MGREDPWRRKWQPTPEFLLGKSHGQRSLVGYSPCCCSVAQSCLTLCDPRDCSMPGFPIHHQLPEPTQTHVHCIGDAIQPFHPLSSSSPPPSIKVFSSESALRMRWPKDWNFSFSISPSNEYSGLISFKIDSSALLLSKGLSRVFSSTTVQKHQFFGARSSLWSNSHIHS